jgi:hypothetical protein
MSSDPEAPIPLEFVEDDFTEEEHRNLDLEISEEYVNPTDFPRVLVHIKRQLGSYRATQAKITREDFSRMIQEQPALRELLLDGSYKLLRRWEVLRNMSRSEPHDTTTIATQITSEAAQLAWVQEYRGDYATIMLNNVDDLPRSQDYPNCIPLIQSSGYGKSRLMDELAKLVFTIPLNIRNPEEHKEGAYPPADPVVWKYLCKTDIRQADEAERLVALFFNNLFLQVADGVRACFKKLLSPEQLPSSKQLPSSNQLLPQGEFADRWRLYLLGDVPKTVPPQNENGTFRSWLYKEVVDASIEALTKKPNMRALKKQLRDNLNDLLAVLKNFCAYPPPGEDGKSCVKIMLYFDEAHELAKDIGSHKNLYDAVWSILAEFRNDCVFTVFLSTQSSMRILAPSQEAARSSRQQNTTALWGPITETPFDCHRMFPLRPGQHGLADVAQLEFLAAFGRPLFWTMLEANQDKDVEALLRNMMNLARKKLLCSNDINATPRNHSQMARIAILDVLITIDYEPRRVSTHQFEMELIASHMRTAFSAPDHRLYVRSGYPSEPFLAEAANRQLHHYMKVDPRFSMIGELKDQLDAGLIDLGQKGEVVMRFLLRRAYMDAIIREQKKHTSPNFSIGCSFVTFLRALFARAFHTSVLNHGPDNIAEPFPPTLQAAFKNAVVRFTHFVKAADDVAMTTRGMTMGFLRGAAIIGWNDQKSIDIAIPILLNRSDKIEEVSMSAFLIQVKRRTQRGTVNAYLIDAEMLDFFGGDAQNDTPYVTLVAELAAKPSPKSPGNVVLGESPVRTSPRLEKPHPRYSIRAYECTHKTWNVVPAADCDQYKYILSLDDLLGDHPRQDEASLRVVRRLLPFWYSDPVWFADKASDEAMVPIPGHEDVKMEQTGAGESMVID